MCVDIVPTMLLVSHSLASFSVWVYKVYKVYKVEPANEWFSVFLQFTQIVVSWYDFNTILTSQLPQLIT